MQRAEQDRGRDEQPDVRASLLDELGEIGHRAQIYFASARISLRARFGSIESRQCSMWS
jgi:hypothetical protein